MLLTAIIQKLQEKMKFRISLTSRHDLDCGLRQKGDLVRENKNMTVRETDRRKGYKQQFKQHKVRELQVDSD